MKTITTNSTTIKELIAELEIKYSDVKVVKDCNYTSITYSNKLNDFTVFQLLVFNEESLEPIAQNYYYNINKLNADLNEIKQGIWRARAIPQ